MGKRFSQTHEWVEIENNNRARVGISDYAQKELGDVVFLELPEVGKEFTQGEQFGTIESTKSVSELYLPVGGKILAVNQKVIDNPALVNQSAEQDGWLVEVELEDASQINSLLGKEDYLKLISQTE